MSRLCTEDDLEYLVGLTAKFNADYYDRPLNMSKTEATLKHILQHGLAIRSDHGAIVGIWMDDPFRDDEFLVELGWFASDSSGIELLSAFEQAGRERGVTEVRMTTLEANNRVGALLRRRGYTSLEHSWRLTLGDTHGPRNASRYRTGS